MLTTALTRLFKSGVYLAACEKMLEGTKEPRQGRFWSICLFFRVRSPEDLSHRPKMCCSVAAILIPCQRVLLSVAKQWTQLSCSDTLHHLLSTVETRASADFIVTFYYIVSQYPVSPQRSVRLGFFRPFVSHRLSFFFTLFMFPFLQQIFYSITGNNSHYDTRLYSTILCILHRSIFLFNNIKMRADMEVRLSYCR
jgi:hypothetical protein